MAHWSESVQDVAGGSRLLVEVSAGAKEARFPDGFNPWREGRIGVRVRAPAEDGRANEKVVRLVAKFLAVTAGAVRIESGAQDPRKSLTVAGLARSDALRLLSTALGAS